MTLKEKLALIQQYIKVPKSKRNDFGEFNFRSAEDIMKVFKKYEEAHKVLLVLSDEVVNIGNGNYIKATATLYDLESSDYLSVSASAREPDNPKPKMDFSQTTGSASSYARKYALNGLLLLDDAIDPDSNQNIDTGQPADEAKVEMIESLCERHNVNIEKLYKNHKVKGRPTAYQAGNILNIFKKQFGDE